MLLRIFVILLPISFAIHIPSESVDKKALTSLGIKTINWQDDQNATVNVHHNYSKVFVQSGYSTSYGQQQVSEDDYTENFEGQETSSSYHKELTNQEIYNTHGAGRDALQFDQIIEAESRKQEQLQDLSDLSDTERSAKNFYALDKPIYVHGFKYPPDPKDVYPLNKNLPKTPPQAYMKCPETETGPFAYALSCNQYLNCWKGRGYVQNCAPGTLFNPETLECDFASKVRCLTGPKKSDFGVGSSQKLELDCPNGFSGVIPHRTDCSKFINCANGVENIMDCPPGTLFSLKINNCDFPYKAECAGWSTEFGGVKVGGSGGFEEDLTGSQSQYFHGNQFGQTGSQHGYTEGKTQSHGNQFGNAQSGSQFGQTQEKYDAQGYYNQGGNQHGQAGTGSYQSQTGHYDQSATYYGQHGQVETGYGYTQGQLGQSGNRDGQTYTGNQYGQAQGHHKQTGGSYGQSESHYVQSQAGSQYDQTQSQFGKTEGGYDQAQNQFGHHGKVGNQFGQTEEHIAQSSHGQTGGRYDQNQFYRGQTGSQTQAGQNQSKYGKNQNTYVQGENNYEQAQQLPGKKQYEQGQGIYGQSSNQNGGQGINQYGQQQETIQHGQGQDRYAQGQGQSQYGKGQSQYEQGQIQYGKGQSQYEQGQSQYGQGQSQYEQGQSQYGQGQNNYGQGQNKYGQGQNQQGQEKYNQNQNQKGQGQYDQTQNQHGHGQYDQNQNQYGQGQYGEGHAHVTNQNQGHEKCPDGLTGLHPHPTDCSKFLNCANGRTTVEICGPGTVFNPKSQVCDYPDKVDCDAQNEDLTGSQSQYIHGRVPGAKSNIVRCPDGATGLYPHPNICSKFLNCANGITYVQDCGPGTVFNPVSKVCDFPYNVDCGGESGSEHGEGLMDIRRLPLPPKPLNVTQDFGIHQGQYQSGTAQGGLYNQGTRWQAQAGTSNTGQGAQETKYNQGTSWQVETGTSNVGQGAQETKYNQGTRWQVQTGTTNAGQGAQETKYNQVQTGTSNTDQDTQETKYNQGTRWQVQTGTTNAGQGAQETKYNQGTRWQAQTGTSNTDQDTQETKYYNQGGSGQNTIDYPYKPSTFPSTDPNADYEFGAPNPELELPAQPPVAQNQKPSQRQHKTSCEPSDFRCSKNDCIPQTMVCDGIRDCANGIDEEQCNKYLEKFTYTSDAILGVRDKKKILKVSVVDCAKNCLKMEEFQCKSFSYRKADGACFLSDSNVGDSGALFYSKLYSYYEVSAYTIDCDGRYKCPNDKCIDFKQVCDGVNDCSDRTDEKGCESKAFGYDIALSGADERHQGRIVVKAFGKTGYICDDKFGLRDADVVCKELGFPLGALEVKGNSYFAQDVDDKDVFYLMDDVTCLGNESTIRDCNFNGWGVHNCETQEIVGVICKTPVENCPKDQWKCDSVQECVPLSFVCDGVFDCTDQSDEAGQHCDAATEIRLSNGKSRAEGRVEIRHHGIWGTVCDDDFNDDAAKVVCRCLGYPGSAKAVKDGYFGPGVGPIWLDQVFCQGNETALQQCVHWNWGEHNCEHSEDVGVICSNSFDEELGNQRNVKVSQRQNVVDVLPEDVLPERCGLRKDDQFMEDDDVHFRVVQGSFAKRGDYPWQASIRIKNKSKHSHWCGAIVISQKFVLTAAHCLQGFSKGAYFVVAGDYNVDESEGTEQEAYIEEFYLHDKFRVGQKMNNDIALIKLKGEGFILTKDIQPICLPPANVAYETALNCTISGFGTEQSGKSGYSHTLKAGWIPLLSKEVCQMPHVYGTTITDGMICAGSLDEGVDACEGDSGGPLACLNEGLFTLYGITSWGQHCGHANKPGVYVKVSYYRDWIDEMIKNHSMEDVPPQ